MMRFEPKHRPWRYGLVAALLATQAGCASKAPEGEAVEQVGTTAQALTGCSAAPGSVSCVAGEPVPDACGAAPCLLDDDGQTCCLPPPPIANVATPGAGNVCVSTTLVRTSGPPNEKTFTFDVPCPSSAQDRYTIVVNNGSGTASLGASAVWIALNGKQVLSPKDLNNQVQHVEIPATLLAGTNTLTLRLSSTPGSSVTVGIRKAPFQLAVGTPLPGQCLGQLPDVLGTTNDACIAVSANGKAGGMAGDAFTVASVPLVEGALVDLLTSGVDWCGNTASDARKVTYDVTQPEIAVEGYTAGEITNQDVTPTFTVTDLNLVELTSVLTLTTGPASQPRGAADTTTTLPFESGQTLSDEGDYALSLHGADCAANTADLADQTFTIDKTPPLITVAGITAGQVVRDAAVTPTLTVADRNLATYAATLNHLPSAPFAGIVSVPFTSGTALSAAGQYTLVVNATDQAGNSSSATLSFTIAACHNGVVEPGEACESGACCQQCDLLADGTTCDTGDVCFQSHACQGGICIGDAPTPSCNVTASDILANAPDPQTLNPSAGLGVTVLPDTTITLNGSPVSGSVPLAAGEVTSGHQVTFHPGLPPGFTVTNVYELHPSGAEFSPPLQVSLLVDPELDSPLVWLCTETSTTCERLPAEVSSATVNGSDYMKLDVSVAHFSRLYVMVLNNSGAVSILPATPSPLTSSGPPPDRQRWMQDIAASIADRKLNQLFIPGSHDSGSYSFPPSSFTASWSQTQSLSFAGQLNAGIRYFDVRMGRTDHSKYEKIGPLYFPACANGYAGVGLECWRKCPALWADMGEGCISPPPPPPGGPPLVMLKDHYGRGKGYFGPIEEFMIHHGGDYTNVRLQEMLDAFRAFLISHPKEIVILQISHYDKVEGHENALYQRLYDMNTGLGPWLMAAKDAGKPLSDLWASDRRALVFVDTDPGLGFPGLTWCKTNDSGVPCHFNSGAGALQSHYFENEGNGQTIFTLFPAANAELSKLHPDLWVLQTILTPGVLNLWTTPAALELTLVPTLDLFLVEAIKSGKRPNIVIADFVDKLWFVDTAIRANSFIPAGSYQQSCSDCTVSGSQLNCLCEDRFGSQVATSINLACGGDISNCDGNLTCGTCPCATLFEHINYGGDAVTVAGGYPWVSDAWNDRVSSMKVTPGCTLTTYEHINQGGDSVSYTSDVSYVGEAWNDRISSLTCSCP